MKNSWLKWLGIVVALIIIIYALLYVAGYRVYLVSGGQIQAAAAGAGSGGYVPFKGGSTAANPTGGSNPIVSIPCITQSCGGFVIAPWGYGIVIKAQTGSSNSSATASKSSTLPGGNALVPGNSSGYYGSAGSMPSSVEGGTTGGGGIGGIGFFETDGSFTHTEVEKQ